MPGSAGGGHSGGSFGGGHSGSFGGGSRSSGSSHSSHSGTFGSGSRSGGGSSYRSSGGYRPVYRSGGYRRRGGSSGGGCLSGVLGAILLPVLLVFVLILAVSGFLANKMDHTEITPSDFSGEVTSEVVWGEKLSAKLCTPVEDVVETDIPDVLDEDGASRVDEALAYFYEKTGVQPYFILLRGLNGSADPDYDTVNDFLYNKYVDTFGSDEGHIIFLMLLDESYNYSTWYIAGDDTGAVVSDDDCETVLDLIDEFAPDSTDVADVVANAFTYATDDIMSTVEYHYIDENGSEVDRDDIVMDAVGGEKYAVSVFVIMVLGAVLMIVLLVRVFRKKAKSAARSAVNTAANAAANAAVNAYKQVNQSGENTGSYTKPAASKPPRANYPVTCPNCGATAYPKDDGTCEYCGGKVL